MMVAQKKQKKCKTWVLIVALIAVVGGGVIFMGAVSGWFNETKIALEGEYYAEGGGMLEMSASEYEELVEARKSFVVLIDQGGCTTADRLRGYVEDWAREKGVVIYRMMFEEMKETSLHEYVKYYPSVAMIARGEVKAYLKADSDDDAAKYNDFAAFTEWMDQHLAR